MESLRRFAHRCVEDFSTESTLLLGFEISLARSFACAICAISLAGFQVGDGTTSVVLLAGEILKHVKGFVEDGLHPQVPY